MAFLVTVVARDLGEILATATVTVTVTSRSVSTGCVAGARVLPFLVETSLPLFSLRAFLSM